MGKGSFIERKVFMEDGAKLYNVIEFDGKEKSVFIGTLYPRELSREEAQKVYDARNPYNFDTEVTNKVEKTFNADSKEELVKTIESRGYDSSIERKFLSFVDDLDESNFSSRGIGSTSTSGTGK